jgi:hypothetical protein
MAVKQNIMNGMLSLKFLDLNPLAVVGLSLSYASIPPLPPFVYLFSSFFVCAVYNTFRVFNLIVSLF